MAVDAVFSAWLTSTSALLVTAGFTNLPATLSMDDLPSGTDHQVFALTEASGPELGDTFGGGTLIERRMIAKVEVAWNPQLDEEAVYAGISDDSATIDAVFLKVSNRTAGVMLVTAEQPIAETVHTTNQIRKVGTYKVRYRVAVDLS